MRTSVTLTTPVPALLPSGTSGYWPLPRLSSISRPVISELTCLFSSKGPQGTASLLEYIADYRVCWGSADTPICQVDILCKHFSTLQPPASACQHFSTAAAPPCQ